MYPNRTQALAGLLGLALACPLSIHAQTTSADPIDETDEARTDEDQMALPRVYVRGAQGGRHYGITGTKTGTPLIETPQSVSVITEEQIRKQGVDDLAQALRYAPGVSGEPFGFEPRTTFIRLRGFDATTTGLYRDGLQLRNPRFAVGYNIELYGAERIDVLRGPASVLYGQGSPGGLINYVSKRPKPFAFGEAELELGSFDQVQGQFDFGAPIGESGALAYRLTGLVRDSDTQVDFVNNDRVFIAPSLTWRPGINTSITFLGYYQNDETRASQAYPAEGTFQPNPNGRVPTDRFTGEPDVDQYDRQEYSVGWLAEHQLTDDWTLRQNARVYASELDDVTVFVNGLDQADLRTLNRAIFGSFGDLDGFAIDNQAQWQFDTGRIGHTLLFGLDYQDVDVGSVQTFGAAPPLDVFDPVYGSSVADPPVFSDTDTSQEQLGFYLQDQLEFGRWTMTLNARFDEAETKTRNLLFDTVDEQDDEEFTGRAGLVYVADNGLAPYISYATSFLPTLGTDADGDPLKPETGEQLEIGVKYQPPGARSFVTFALFDIERDDVVEFDPATFLPIQTGQIRSRGLEVEAVADFRWGLDVIASYSYLDMEIRESVIESQLGERPAQVPEHKASIWADYRFRGGALDGLGFGLGVRYNGETFGNVPNTVKVPDHTLVDAAAYYNLGAWQLSLNLQNALDNRVVPGCFVRASVLCTYGQVRTVSGSIRYRWGQ